MFELGRKADPADREWLEELARVYAQTKETKKQISVLRDLIPQDADDLDRRIRLARLLGGQKDERGEREGTPGRRWRWTSRARRRGSCCFDALDGAEEGRGGEADEGVAGGVSPRRAEA